jgi:hypothetical protein
MSRGGIATFILIVHFLNDKSEPCHVIVEFFEIVNRFGDAMVIQMSNVFAKHGLGTHILAYVKNEGNNLATMTFVLTFVLSCEVLGLLAPFVGSCWGHAMFKCCEYVIDNSKVCVGMPSTSIKEA